MMTKQTKKNGTSLAEQMANEIISVQPMPSNIVKELYEQSMTKEQLKAEGYKPVSRLGLMWIKEDKR